jgi:hypothetical protein
VGVNLFVSDDSADLTIFLLEKFRSKWHKGTWSKGFAQGVVPVLSQLSTGRAQDVGTVTGSITRTPSESSPNVSTGSVPSVGPRNERS